MEKFLGYKLNPIISLPVEFWRGRSVVGEERAATETALRAITPIVWEQAQQQFRLL